MAVLSFLSVIILTAYEPRNFHDSEGFFIEIPKEFFDKTRKLVNEARLEMLSDRGSAQTFLHKIREFEQLEREERAYRYDLSIKLHRYEEEETRAIIKGFIEASTERIKHFQDEAKRFSRYHSSALGHTTKNHFDLEALKTQLDPEIVIGYKAQRKLSKYTIFVCPLHSDKTPSLFFYPKGYFHCFSCRFHGSNIDMYMQLKQRTFVEACKDLMKLL